MVSNMILLIPRKVSRRSSFSKFISIDFFIKAVEVF